jgi:hypothetical protein
MVRGRQLDSIHEFSGTGWHLVFETYNTGTPGESFGGKMSWGHINMVGQHMALYFGRLDYTRCYRMFLPTTWANPRAQQSANQPFADHLDTYFLRTPWFDGGLRGYNKIAAGLQIAAERLPEDYMLSVFFQVDYDVTQYTLMSGITADDFVDGLFVGEFGDEVRGIYDGRSFKRIRFTVQVGDPNGDTDTFIINDVVFSYIKTTASTNTWNVSIRADKNHGDYTAEQLMTNLKGLVAQTGFTDFRFSKDEDEPVYRVFVSRSGGNEALHFEEGGSVMLGLLEINSSP